MNPIPLDFDQLRQFEIQNWQCPHCQARTETATALEILHERYTCKCPNCNSLTTNPVMVSTFRFTILVEQPDGTRAIVRSYSSEDSTAVKLARYMKFQLYPDYEQVLNERLTRMTDNKIDYSDFPIGRTLTECLLYLKKKQTAVLTIDKVANIIRDHDDTHALTDIRTSLRKAAADIGFQFCVNHKKSKVTWGLNNGMAKLTPDHQSKIKSLYAHLGNQYTQIAQQVGVTRNTVKAFVLGHSYKNTLIPHQP